jgi:prepilin-type N-terminal cleavage/methylation domain-containing protein
LGVTRAGRSGQEGGGFTLAELVVVLAIVGVLALVAAPRYAASITRYRADVSARRVKADVEQARTRARSTSQAVDMAFDASTESYTINGATGLDRSSTYVVELDEPPYDAEIVLADFGGATTLSIDGYGVCAATGRVVIRSGSEYRTVFVGTVAEAVEEGNKATPTTMQDLGGGVSAALK